MTTRPITECQLHLPWKEWSGDPHEAQNYYELERWSMRLADCVSACTCSVEQWALNGTAADDTVTVISRAGSTTLCGTTETTHAFIVYVHLLWTGNNTGARDLELYGNGEHTRFPGMTAPGCIASDGFQRMHTSNIMPAHLNTLSPKYFLNIWQNSGGPLNYFLQVDEYYPCCNCDWPYPC